jgi:hypothetical protein
MFNHFLRATLPVSVVGLGILSTLPAHAELGGMPMPTPQGATVVTIAPPLPAASSGTAARYTVKQTTLASGTVVREYTGQDGRVFGVAWSGPSMPELASLLGGYAPLAASAVEAQRTQHSGMRGSARVDQPGFVVNSGGHMGHFAGQAYLPQGLPAGTSANDIK